jgi:hypothetical protein
VQPQWISHVKSSPFDQYIPSIEFDLLYSLGLSKTILEKGDWFGRLYEVIVEKGCVVYLYSDTPCKSKVPTSTSPLAETQSVVVLNHRERKRWSSPAMSTVVDGPCRAAVVLQLGRWSRMQREVELWCGGRGRYDPVHPSPSSSHAATAHRAQLTLSVRSRLSLARSCHLKASM